MKNLRTIKWILITLIISNVASISALFYYLHQDENVNFQQPFRGGGMNRILIERLELNAGQINKFHQLKRGFHDDVSKEMVKLQEMRVAFFDELENDNPNRQKLEQYAEEIGGNHEEIKKASIDHYMEIKKLFSPRQQEIFFGILKQKGHPMGHGFRGMRTQSFRPID